MARCLLQAPHWRWSLQPGTCPDGEWNPDPLAHRWMLSLGAAPTGCPMTLHCPPLGLVR